MRILAIRGENLASLTAFDLPLATGPLGGVGLFAITGDTGAGKSTILDAMCLALYGRYPRTSAGGREKVADAGGEDISASDPSHILRRGAASCFAETDFVGLDGRSYRARWAVRRARGKATGKLQNPEHTLSLLDGRENIAAKTTATTAAVEERSGFTFDQFCRTVLLAQGEFDRFLLADETQRGELLEKITGTGIYSKISSRVNKETGDRKRRFEDLELLRGGITPLEARAREALAAEREQTSTRLEAAIASAERIKVNLEHAGRIAKARQDLDDAHAAVVAARAAAEAAGASRDHLALLRAVEPLRAVSIMFEQCGKAVTTAAAKRSEAAIQLQRALDAKALAVGKLQGAKDAAEAADANVKRFEPEWTAAAALDVQIVTARTELSGVAAAHEAAVIEDKAAQQEATRLSAESARLEAAKAKAEADLEACASRAPLAANIARIATAIGDRIELLGRRSACEETGERLRDEIAELNARVKAAEEAASGHSTRRVELARQLDERRRALDALDLPRLDLRYSGLSNLVAGLDRVMAVIERRDEALAQAARAGMEAGQAEADGRAAAARVEAARLAHGACLKSRQDFQALSDLADATLAAHANRLRSVLVDGEPCPVCGAASHPFATGQAEASRLANGIRDQRKALDAEIAAAADELLQAQTAEAAARLRRKAADATAVDARGKGDSAAQQLRAVTPGLLSAARELGFGDLTLSPDAEPVGARVTEQRFFVAAKLEEAANRRKAGQALRNDADGLQAEIDGVSRRAEAEREAAESDRAALAQANASALGNAVSADELGRQLAASFSELEPYLAIAGIAAGDLDGKAIATRERLAQLARNYDDLSQGFSRLCEDAVTARNALRTADERAQVSARAAGQALQMLTHREAALKTLSGQRAALLGGEATNQHRGRVLGLADKARMDLAAARDVSAEADAACAAVDASHMARVAEQDASQQAFAEASLSWTTAVAALALTPQRVMDLLAEPADTANGLAAHLDVLDHALRQAVTIAGVRQSELDGQLQTGPEPDAPALEQLRGERETQLALSEALTTERNQFDFALKTDDDARGRMATLAEEIRAAKADLDVWSAVDDAVGAANGSKFRRFAQGVTLGHLVHLANIQLAALNPRYALRINPLTDLSLDVTDRDMGDEVRGPRSLSGGERFLVSLALALALSGLEGRQSFVDSLFIDEGFGGLDRDTLDMAIDALESLQSHGRKVGVITHVAAMIERIPVQVRVEKRGGGRSVVRLQDHAPPGLGIAVDLLAAAE